MERAIVYKGKKVKFWDNGSGKVVVLLHGYLESSLSWGQFSISLAERYRVITLDLPGHGASETNGEIHTMEYMAGAVFEIISFLEINKVFLIGHSLGGYVAMAFLELYPEKLFGYCLFHSHPFADGAAAIEKRRREIQIAGAGKKNLMYPDNVTRMFADVNLIKFGSSLEKAKEIASHTPGEGIIAVLNGMIQRPSRAALFEKGVVPSLWLLGRMDNYINYETITKSLTLPVNASVVILEESGHLGFIEEEELSLSTLIEFINFAETQPRT